jgi:hypothetical protein
MAFKIKKKIDFITTARIVTPTLAEPLVDEVQVQFRYVEDAETLSVDDFLHAAVVTMFDLTDDAGHPVEFDDFKQTLLAMPQVRLGLTEAYFKAFSEARVKN